MATLDLPYQDQISQDSSPSKEGFALSVVNYGGKISQRAFDGVDADTSREIIWDVKWELIEHATPEEVAQGQVDQLGKLREFYQQSQLGKVRWRPFEFQTDRIWEIVPDSLQITSVAGCIFTASLKLKYLYDE